MVLLAVRRWAKSPFAMPVALLTMWLIGTVALRPAFLGLFGPEHGWYLPSLKGRLTEWSPFKPGSYNAPNVVDDVEHSSRSCSP